MNDQTVSLSCRIKKEVKAELEQLRAKNVPQVSTATLVLFSVVELMKELRKGRQAALNGNSKLPADFYNFPESFIKDAYRQTFINSNCKVFDFNDPAADTHAEAVKRQAEDLSYEHE